MTSFNPRSYPDRPASSARRHRGAALLSALLLAAGVGVASGGAVEPAAAAAEPGRVHVSEKGRAPAYRFLL
ncbi:hypothetical protein ACN27G_05610 [Plantactinospora sp. WMMB334]|uniref:hypothetical protein n=1 Tax=Plantactinospora sp. WMMB334 TaxID=3404119 RepID=UPI003B9522C3